MPRQISESGVGSTRPSVVYEFIYNGEGDLYELRNYKIHRAAFFEYDHAGRCMSLTEKSFTGTYGSAITYTGTVSGYGYKYDANNNLLELTCNVGGSNWTTNYHYDGDNRPTETVFHNGRKIVVTYDDIGRITSKALKNGNSTILNTTVGYTPGANGSGTALVASYKNGTDDAYNYTYDANGNITQIWRGNGTFSQASVKFSYVYDKANQLIRENLYYGSGNSNNATYAYSYDNWGNLLTRKKYAYTTVVHLISGTETETINYGYSNTQWGDLLTSFNGSTITYDAMGNPTSSLGMDQPFRYRGYVYDTETQWYYLQSRYYDPATCRFISADVLLSTGQGVIGHNSFAYCLNNPVNGSDSGGKRFNPNSVMMTDSGGGFDYYCIEAARRRLY